jgi:NAD(P)-dependent dehydrogenase (short-subunit alcohol dehydrogenase family)
VLDNDLVRPEHAMIAGLTRSAPYDLPGLRLRHLDTAPGDGGFDQLADEIGADPAHAPDAVALRGGHRWAPVVDQVRVPAPADPVAGLRAGGVYLITGGLGAIGLAVAEDFARRAQARLVLLGRTPLPPPDEWDAYLTANCTDQIGRAIAAIRRITGAGGEVATAAADVTDPAALRVVRERLFERYGRLDGIVHAAGVAGGGLTATRTTAAMAPVMAAKVTGTLALREVFGDVEQDFVALFSSVVGTVGGLGEVDYCAANAYLDAYAQSDHGWRAPVRSLAWAGWRGAGMLADTLAAMGTSTMDDNPAWIAPEEGVAALHRAFAVNLGGHVLISPQPVDVLRRRVPERPPPAVPPAAAVPAAGLTEVEAGIAKIWSALLGTDSIAPDDDFFALGGNSLLAVQLIAQVRKAYAVRLPMRSIFDTPTVAGMAARVERLRAPMVEAQ